ncbi:Trans-aconitate 3-methyltransferase [Nakaseomyces bracarensis]|uniref:Trans-aconitate 3-methyltransferase n=1 Tax=Nakaseomyces bracarensis TaxID=273131 RepID=A0ABR4NY77_9SACH
MSSFSSKNFDSENYSKNRPQYPLEFYAHLESYHQGQLKLIVDQGCGPGTATIQMRRHFNNVPEIIGTDVSPVMVNEANSVAARNGCENIKFFVAGGGDFSFLGDRANNKNVDLVVSAEAIQYFDIEKFQEQVAINLRSGGTLAYWGYLNPIVCEYPDMDQQLIDFLFSPDKLAPYWELPANEIIGDYYQGIKLNLSHFKDIEVKVFDPRDSNYDKCPLQMKCEMTVQGFADYLSSWGIYYKWKNDPKNQNKKDIIEEITSFLYDKALSKNSVIHISWTTFYTFARAV